MYPTDYLYSREHEWVRVQDDVCTLGITEFAQQELGEVVFGGVGSGLYGMLACAILAVFIAGLMIGRSPEYLGKKIEAHDMKMVSIVILATPLLVLGGTALAVSVAVPEQVIVT